MSKQGRYIAALISEGEHQRQDFKYEISDAKKIARSIAAFANTDGGRLLIGVKDNGNIAGVRSEEEFYMLESAATMYCQPPVNFRINEYLIRGKTVLEVIIDPSEKKPHKAPDKDGNYKVYIRVQDQNLLANGILLKVWERQKKQIGSLLTLTGAEKWLLDYLSVNPNITKTKFCRLAKINSNKANQILLNMVSAQVVKIEFTGQQIVYSIHPDNNS